MARIKTVVVVCGWPTRSVRPFRKGNSTRAPLAAVRRARRNPCCCDCPAPLRRTTDAKKHNPAGGRHHFVLSPNITNFYRSLVFGYKSQNSTWNTRSRGLRLKAEDEACPLNGPRNHARGVIAMSIVGGGGFTILPASITIVWVSFDTTTVDDQSEISHCGRAHPE